MKKTISQLAIIVAATAIVCLAGEPLAIPWYTIDGGGVMRSESNDGRFALSGTIGQPDAGEMFGGDGVRFTLTGGFWFGVVPGDCNANGFMDLGDHAIFVDCMTHFPSDIAPRPGCECADIDNSGTIDLRDFKDNQQRFLGSGTGD